MLMRPATMRVFWYVGLIFVAIGLSRISHSGVPEAFFSAVSVYIPASLLRLLLGRFIVEPGDDSNGVFGIDRKKFNAMLLFGGCAVAASLLCIGQILAASFAITAALCGVDGLLTLHSLNAKRALSSSR
jgi:hypothetical protein